MKATVGGEREQLHELARLLEPPGGLRHRDALDGGREAPEQGHAYVAHRPSMTDRLLLVKLRPGATTRRGSVLGQWRHSGLRAVGVAAAIGGMTFGGVARGSG